MRQKFSIAKCALAAVAALLVLCASGARADSPVIIDQAPQRYVVQKGDTLWGIAGKFLKEPWRWPEIWRMNRDEIKNPHRIYPGDVIVLDRATGQLSLERPVTRLSPAVRTAPLDAEAIPSIPPGDIEPYLSRPLVTAPDGLADAAVVVAGREPHVVRARGDAIYVTGIDPKAGDLWYIYRRGRSLSPIDGGDFLGEEQKFVGSARVERFGDVSTMRIVSSKQEIIDGDHLVPAPREQLINYAPHAPARPIEGRIIAIDGDAFEAARGTIVTVDLGAQSGLDVGTVLAIYRVVPPIVDPRPTKEQNQIMQFVGDMSKAVQPDRFINVPDERSGLMFVFRVFDRVAYAVVLSTNDPVVVGDYVRQP
jgi:hypothetical protein